MSSIADAAYLFRRRLMPMPSAFSLIFAGFSIDYAAAAIISLRHVFSPSTYPRAYAGCRCRLFDARFDDAAPLHADVERLRCSPFVCHLFFIFLPCWLPLRFYFAMPPLCFLRL